MTIVVNSLRQGFYLDSVALMRHSRTIASRDGVEEAALMVGTPANRQILADAGLLADPGEAAGGNDLIIAVRALDRGTAEAALAAAEQLLDQPVAGAADGTQWRPRTLRGAIQAQPDANLAMVSVPGDFAAAEARKALRRGLHVLIFSDNVPLEHELALKLEARELGRLVMGPDCGTAIINGVPLAFANRVPRGDVGIIGASGTGTQEISVLLALGGRGVSQAIGVGGRDLKEEIGGITTFMALDALERDPETRQVILVSKPPSPAVAARLVERVAQSAKHYTLCLIGAETLDLPPNAVLAPTLKAAAEDALGAEVGAGFSASALAKPLPSGRRRVQGLFSGGTLAAEAQVVFKAAGEPLVSNAPIPGVAQLGTDDRAHAMIDLGADEYTRGRPHPMIDPTVRDESLGAALDARDTGVVLLDVVLGFGAHHDPAGHLARILSDGPGGGPVVVASVTGVEADPQVRSRQIATLEAAGVLVAPSNAQAAELALAHLKADG
jgi:succinyl-CoA synthetase alpha subunit